MSQRFTRDVKLAALATAKHTGAFRLARRLSRGHLRILCYHGFETSDEASFRPKMFVSGSLLEHRLEQLLEMGASFLPLSAAVEGLYSGSLPDLPVVVTIDDGWASTYTIALPIFQRLNLPVTVYVTSYYAQKGTPVASMAIQYMFWKSSSHAVDLRGLPVAGPAVVDLRNPQSVQRCIDDLLGHMEQCDTDDARQSIARTVGQRLGIDYATVARSRMLSMMNEAEIRAAAASGVDIQLHTHRHRFEISDPEGALREIADNRSWLAPKVTGDLNHFCYPSGAYDPLMFPLLRGSSIVSATTCEPGLNTRETEPLALRRFLDGTDVDDLEFEAELCGFRELIPRR